MLLKNLTDPSSHVYHNNTNFVLNTHSELGCVLALFLLFSVFISQPPNIYEEWVKAQKHSMGPPGLELVQGKAGVHVS